MIRSVSSPAGRALAALCLAGLAAASAIAQDPKAIAAQGAARDWLQLTDRGDAQASWNAASKKFRNTLSLSGWVEALKKDRVPLGAVKSRAAVKTTFQSTFPGVPDGDYSLIAFTTSFANNPQGHETITLERGTDGQWRVVGYFVR